MKPSEFYEKYWTVDGKPVPPLPDREKAIWDIAYEMEVAPYIKVWRRKYGWVYLVNPLIDEVLNQERRFE